MTITSSPNACSFLRIVLIAVIGFSISSGAAKAESPQPPSPANSATNEFCGTKDGPTKTVFIPKAFDEQFVATIVGAAAEEGNVERGMHVFRSAKFACISCHKVDDFGGAVGPALSDAGKRLKPEQIVESILWPDRTVHADYTTWLIQLADGQTLKGYKRNKSADAVEIFDPASQKSTTVLLDDIEAERPTGTLMPVGLANSMSVSQRRDLVRFLTELGHTADLADRLKNIDKPTQFVFGREPLDPKAWTLWQEPVNRDRIYDFYRKEALHFRDAATAAHLLPAYPGLDGGTHGHWGNQNEQTWRDGRWSETNKSPVLAGVTHLPGRAISKGICVEFGDKQKLSACFNPETLAYEAVWRGGFVKFSAVRHGFMDGLRPDGELLPTPKNTKRDQPFAYHGYYRVGPRIVFAYRIGDVEYLDSPWVDTDGNFQRQVAPRSEHPLASQIQNPPTQWPLELVTKGQRGSDERPYAIDTIKLPFDNPYGSLLFIAGHDFLSDGTAVLSTMTGDVWLVSGLDDDLQNVRWKRFAAGLHQPLGVVVAENNIYVLGRDQITRLVDLNGDREADFYECFSSVYTTSRGGHDFTCGLARDAEGRFYTAAGKEGLIRISADGKRFDVLATGFRNPDGIGLCQDGKLTVPCSEGDWTPASMICLVDPKTAEQGQPPHFGHKGPRNGQPPALPLVYLPRGIDNSSGGQVQVNDERFGPLSGHIIHTSFGSGSHFLVLRDEVDGQPQGSIVPLVGEFRSGAHRAKVNPQDGQLYISGMAGWGSYTPDDGCFQRVRYTGKPMQMPTRFHIHENGVLVQFALPVDKSAISETKKQFAQAWNYHYGPGYGSPELAPSHPGIVGHESLEISGVHQVSDNAVFVEIPDIQPVSQLHLLLQVDQQQPQELFVTVHKLDAPFTKFPGYKPVDKIIAAHPIATYLALLGNKKKNPWEKKPDTSDIQKLTIKAGPNLTYSVPTLHAKAGKTIELTFTNPDVVPHNWVLIQPGTLETVGDLANKFVADPNAVLEQYVPKTENVIAYTDIVPPGKSFTIYFTAPEKPGTYPYLCTFPGHWMVMNGKLVVE
ncbi:heme-binding domain-containing protein [bacterium]|nr:heme-binding domain-containing protein [bacterium]